MEPPPKLRIPRVRHSLVVYLEGFADIDYQTQVWHRRIMPEGVLDSFDDSINELYLALADKPALDSIGDVLYDVEEAVAVDAVLEPLNRVLAAVGQMGTYDEASHHKDWPKVVKAAQRALDVLRRSDERYAHP